MLVQFRVFSSLAVLSFFALSVQAATEFDGDNPFTPVTLEQFGNGPGSSVLGAGGNPGGYLQLTDAVNGQNNFVTFDLSDPGPYASSTFSFDFIIDPTDTGPSADGFSFSYADTGVFSNAGGIGSPPFTPEDPAAAGIFGALDSIPGAMKGHSTRLELERARTIQKSVYFLMGTSFYALTTRERSTRL